MRIGLAITTYKRPEHLRVCLAQVKKHTPANVVIHVSDDSNNRKGIAYRKTECLDVLWKAGCDYFFLLDDDCFPIADGWIDFFIRASKRTGQEHFCYTPGSHMLRCRNGINICTHNKGVLLFLTRRVVRHVGAFYRGYKIYGAEHTTYSRRVHRAGFTSYGQALSVAGTEKFIYALDFDTHLRFNRKLHHKSTVSRCTRDKFLSINRSLMNQDVMVYRPLPSMRGPTPPAPQKRITRQICDLLRRRRGRK